MKPFFIRLDRSNTSLHGQWWWTIDRYLLLAVIAIMIIGIVLVMAASPAIAEHKGLHSFHFVYRQMVFLTAGAAAMVMFSHFPVGLVRRISALGFAVCVVLLLYVAFFGQEIKGAKSWIHLPGFALQPSEFMKPFFIVMTAWALSRRSIKEGFPGFPVAIGLYAVVAGLLMLQPDFGMTMLVSLVWGGQLFMAGLPLIFVGIIGGVSVGGIVAAYLMFPHVARRINSFFDPSTGDNYQVEKAQEAIMSGGPFGVGPGAGVIKGRVPDAHADFIFAVAGEEYGTILCILLVLLFAFVVIRGFSRVFREGNLFVMYAAAGLLLEFGLQALINIGVTLALIPNTGMTLPLVSYGGSATLASAIAMGMVLSLTRKRYGESGH